MDRQFHLLDTFPASGSDGRTYKVCAYEHLRRDESVGAAQEHWLPTGQTEYRLESGELLHPRQDGSMVIPASGVTLARLN